MLAGGVVYIAYWPRIAQNRSYADYSYTRTAAPRSAPGQPRHCTHLPIYSLLDMRSDAELKNGAKNMEKDTELKTVLVNYATHIYHRPSRYTGNYGEVESRRYVTHCGVRYTQIGDYLTPHPLDRVLNSGNYRPCSKCYPNGA